MGFKNPSSVVEIPTDLKKEIKAKELQTKIDALVEVKNNLEKEVSQRQKEEKNFIGISFDIESKTIELDILLKKIKTAETELEEKMKEFRKYNDLIQDREELEEKLKSLQLKVKELSDINTKIEEKLGLFKLLGENYQLRTDEFNQVMDEFAKKQKETTEKLDFVLEQLTKARLELTEKEENLKILEKQFADKTFIFEELSGSIKLLKQQKKDELSSAKQKLEEELSLLQKEFDEKNRKREEELNEKEGALSIKESWLKEKENYLVTTKADLEKFFNRKININI